MIENGSEIISKAEIKKAFKIWLEGLPEEIEFWDDYLSSKGGDSQGEFFWRMQAPNRWIGEEITFDHLTETLDAIPHHKVEILDVGSGALSILGHKHKGGKEIAMTLCDPLAPIYNKLSEKHKIEIPIKPIFADAENLSSFFAPNSFDIATSRNALDHSYNPVGAILNIMQVVKVGGTAFLFHYENEAENNLYCGLHQWNFTLEGKDMIIWNKSHRFSLQKILGDRASVEAKRTESHTPSHPYWIGVRVQKNKEISFPANDLSFKYALALEKIFDFIHAEKKENKEIAPVETNENTQDFAVEAKRKRKLRALNRLLLLATLVIIGLCGIIYFGL